MVLLHLTDRQWHTVVGVFSLFCLLAVKSINSLALTSQQKTEILNMHNRLRSGVYPPAANMNYLSWNNYLEKLAQDAANRCTMEHNYGGAYASLGENIYKGWRTNMTEIAQFWFTESLLYTYPTTGTPGNCNTTGRSLNMCGHYWQTVGGTIEQMGCAIQHCPSTTDYAVVCEYDKSAPSNVYSSGKPCSQCLHPRGECYNGLCINATMKAAITSSDAGAVYECKILCKNCGTPTDVATTGICACNCDTSKYTGNFCETLKSGATHSTVCSTCARLNTPCLNGGWEPISMSTTCQCTCPSGFFGSQCQIPEIANTNGVTLVFTPPKFCYNSDCMGYPITRTIFRQSVWPSIKTSVVSSVNTHCSSNTNYATCCPAGGSYAGGGGKAYIAEQDLSYLDFETVTGNLGQLTTVIYATVRFPNALCTVTPASKTSVPQSVLLQSTVISNLNSSVLSCCTYQTAASAYIGAITTTTTTPATTTNSSAASKNISEKPTKRVGRLAPNYIFPATTIITLCLSIFIF